MRRIWILGLLAFVLVGCSSSPAAKGTGGAKGVFLVNDSAKPIRVTGCPICSKGGLVLPATEKAKIGPPHRDFSIRIQRLHASPRCLQVGKSDGDKHNGYTVNASAAKPCG